MRHNLADGLDRFAQAAPESLSLCLADSAISYGALAALGRRIAGWLLARGAVGRVGVLAGRSVGAYAGGVGVFWAGGTYVPLGLSWPEERLRVTAACRSCACRSSAVTR